MIEYLPWSKSVLNNSIELYKKGIFSVIDLEVGGGCNFSCVYCDSPSRNVFSKINITQIEHIFENNDIDWLYICGLGEPLFGENRKLSSSLMELCSKYNIKCSIFTNSSIVDNEIIDYLDTDLLNLLVKLDSSEISKIEKLYGTKLGKECLSNLKKIEDHIQVTNNCSNVAASIVPTTINQEELPEIVEYCLDRDIFPLIGYLERAGNALNCYNEMYLPIEKLCNINEQIYNLTGENYKIPSCPAVIGGIHINANNKVVVDKLTGLSCSWFWLKTPDIEEIYNFNSEITDDSWEKVSAKIIQYRRSKLDEVRKIIETLKYTPFGGCGGEVKSLLTEYLTWAK